MQQDLLFSETQRFTQSKLLMIVYAINVIAFLVVAFMVEMSRNQVLLITALLILLMMAFTYIFRLETQIKKDGIYVRFFPFHLSFRHYTWDSIQRLFVRQYKPIQEYGGWGLRYNFLGNGRALNIAGNQGLQIEFTDQKRLLIGTQKPDEVALILQRLGQIKK